MTAVVARPVLPHGDRGAELHSARGGGRAGAAPLSPAAQAVLESLVRQLEPRLDVLAATVASRVRDNVTEYHGLAGRLNGLGVDDFVLRIARIGLRVLADGGRPSGDELVALRAVGASRAAQALSLDSVLAGLRLGVWLGWNEVITQVRALPLAEANIAVLGTLAMRLFGFADEAAAALSAGHSENREHTREREEQRVALVEELLAGSFASEDDMVRRAAGFGYDLTAPHGLLLLSAPDRAAVRAVAQALRRALPGAIAVAPRGGVRGHAALVVPCVDRAGWMRVLACARDVAVPRGVWVLSADPVVRPARLAAAYVEAADCVGLAAAMYRRARVVGADELLAHRAVQGRPEDRRRFVERTLGPVLALPGRHAEPLLDTLEGLIEHGGNVEATRRALSVHDKTIRYRVRRIRELTGLCPLRDRGRLELALMLHRLAGVEAVRGA